MSRALTLQDRADAYAAGFPEYPASHPFIVEEKSGPVLYAVWLGGQNYRNISGYYGSYPPHYLERASAFFPDLMCLDQRTVVLHAFSGSLPAGPYARCDLRQDAEFNCDVRHLPLFAGDHRWRLVFADPPYSAADAKRYGTPMVDRLGATKALARVTAPGGFLVWLDVTWPIFRSDEWRTVARIFLVLSTNKRIRKVSIFERRAAA